MKKEEDGNPTLKDLWFKTRDWNLEKEALDAAQVEVARCQKLLNQALEKESTAIVRCEKASLEVSKIMEKLR